MSLNTFFHQHPVFTRDELLCQLGDMKSGTPNPNTVRALLSYHQGKGHILQVRRGLFASVTPGVDPEQAPVDAYLIAAKSQENAILAFHTALELHGLAYSSFESIQVLSERPLRPWSFRGVTYQPVKVQEALQRAGKTHWGVETMDRFGQDIQVTSRERTFVDVLDRPDLGGGWEEVWRSLETLRVLVMDDVLTYVGFLGNATTAALVGFYLEQHQEGLAVDEGVLRNLEALRPKGAHYLDSTQESRLAKRWNLIVPVAVWKRSWEEPR